MLCVNMFEPGGCKRFNCWHSHEKKNAKFIRTKYSYYSMDKNFLITEDTNGNGYYIPCNVIERYLNNIPSRDIDFEKMTYEGYFDINSRDNTNYRYRFVYLSSIKEIKQISSNLRIYKPISTSKMGSPASSIVTTPKIDSNEIKELKNTINELKNFVNENSIDVSTKFKELQQKINHLKEELENKTKEFNDLRNRFKNISSTTNKVESNQDKRKIEKTYDLRSRKRVKYN